jgi:hypothetical protein
VGVGVVWESVSWMGTMDRCHGWAPWTGVMDGHHGQVINITVNRLWAQVVSNVYNSRDEGTQAEEARNDRIT